MKFCSWWNYSDGVKSKNNTRPTHSPPQDGHGKKINYGWRLTGTELTVTFEMPWLFRNDSPVPISVSMKKGGKKLLHEMSEGYVAIVP